MGMGEAAPTIVWFRQDLRLLDNPALSAAVAEGRPVVPLYVLATEEGDWAMGGASRWWLHHSLASLAASLEGKGARLVLRRGDPARVAADLAAECGAASVHANICPEPRWRAADGAVASRLQATGRDLARHRSFTLFDPDVIKTRADSTYGMFTPFANALRGAGDPPPPLPEPTAILRCSAQPGSEVLADWGLLPRHPDWSPGLAETFTPGEPAARARGRWFLRGAVHQYDSGRNLPGQDLTSMLSPHLHWGEISAASLWHALQRWPADEAARSFANELIWRDFAAYLLWHHPTLPDRPLREEFEHLPWRHDPAGLHAWQRGQTGIPIVDAGMRQLWRTGWMHNRVRMVVASFLVKHLLIHWRLGAQWFWDTLVDADLGANSMNWQWAAGTGIDSQPFFRIFNPVTQGEKFDADGAYVRRFVPELARLPAKFLHAPWLAPPLVLAEAGVALGRTYPAPIVDLAAGRARALELWRQTVRGGAPGSAVA
jgi:deoxyribodipyrimidine photo-lyase